MGTLYGSRLQRLMLRAASIGSERGGETEVATLYLEARYVNVATATANNNMTTTPSSSSPHPLRRSSSRSRCLRIGRSNVRALNLWQAPSSLKTYCRGKVGWERLRRKEAGENEAMDGCET